MKNERSFTELMKSQAENRKKVDKNYMKRLYVEMVLTEAVLKLRRENLLQEIDYALDVRNETAFYALSDELNDLTTKFGA